MLIFIKTFFVSLMLPLFLFSQWKPLAYKPLASKTIHLKLLRVINPRFPKMSDKQLNIYLHEAQKVVWKHFGIKIVFHLEGEWEINRFFNHLAQNIKAELYKEIYDFRQGSGDKKRLVKDIASALAEYSKVMPLSDLIDYARPHLLQDLKEKNLYTLAEALITTEISRLKRWTHIKATDGKAVIDNSFYNEWVFWDAIGHFQTGFDVVLTNQLIASAEYHGQDIHSALRGGIVAGTTSYMKGSRFDAFIFVTSFLYINNDPFIKTLRGNKTYNKHEAALYAGAYLAHEIGHMIFRFGHPFNEKSCVMNPAELLHFDDWYQQIDAKKCPIGSNSSMTPGSVTLFYNDAWK